MYDPCNKCTIKCDCSDECCYGALKKYKSELTVDERKQLLEEIQKTMRDYNAIDKLMYIKFKRDIRKVYVISQEGLETLIKIIKKLSK